MFAPLDDLEAAIEKVAAFEGTLDVERICKLAERMEFLRVSAIGRYDRSGEWKAEGFQSAAAGLRSKCRMVQADAGSAVMLARRLESLPETAGAFGAGEISRRHAAVIARAYTPERAVMLSGIEAELVALARLTDPMVLRGKVRQMTDAFDGDGGANSDAADYAKNRLTFDATFNGRFEPHGSFDPESGDIIATALAAEMEVLRQAGDTRSIPRQRAEALTSISRWYLAEHDHGHHDRRRGQTHLNIIWDLADLADTNPSLLADVRAESAYASMLSRNTLERLACDCTFNRILMDGPSQIIDVGRSTRNIPEPLWKALVARDQHCTEPGCKRGPGHCEGHHIRYWTNGGPTNLDNLRLLCWYHHRELHAHDHHTRARPG